MLVFPPGGAAWQREVERDLRQFLTYFQQLWAAIPASDPTESVGTGIYFYNNTGVTVPAGAVMQVTGATTIQNRPCLTVQQYSAYGSRWDSLINGPVGVTTGTVGLAVNPYMPGEAMYFTSPQNTQTPSTAGLWGPIPGSWGLWQGVGGFWALGDLGTGWQGSSPINNSDGEPVFNNNGQVQNSTAGMFQIAPWLMFTGKTNLGIKGMQDASNPTLAQATGAVNVYGSISGGNLNFLSVGGSQISINVVNPWYYIPASRRVVCIWDAVIGWVIAAPSDQNMLVGTANAAINQGSSGTITLLGSSNTVTALARLGKVAQGATCYVQFCSNSGKLEIINANLCSPTS